MTKARSIETEHAEAAGRWRRSRIALLRLSAAPRTVEGALCRVAAVVRMQLRLGVGRARYAALVINTAAPTAAALAEYVAPAFLRRAFQARPAPAGPSRHRAHHARAFATRTRRLAGAGARGCVSRTPSRSDAAAKHRSPGVYPALWGRAYSRRTLGTLTVFLGSVARAKPGDGSGRARCTAYSERTPPPREGSLSGVL